MHETPASFSKLLENSRLHALILIVIALLIYSNTFQVPLLFDDEGSIQLNPAVQGLANFFNGGYKFLPNRVIGYFTFALNYQFGELNVVGYHIVNLIIHIICALLVYCLVKISFQTPRLKNSFSKPHISQFAFVAALLFVSHPIQTQAVTYIVQRLTTLTTLFYLSALICYIRWRLAREESTTFLKGLASPWYVASFMAVILAMKTKEIAFTLPVIVLLYECSFFGWTGRKLLAQMTPLFMTMAIIPYTVFVTVSPTLTSGGSLLSDVNSPAYSVVRMTRWEYLFTQFSVILTYLRLLILPVNQNLDYDYPINHTFFEPRSYISLLVLLSILLLALFMFLKSITRPADEITENTVPPSKALYLLASFGIFWFFITLSVESSIITLRDVIFEHRLYLPSYGFFLTAVSCGTLGVLRLEQKFKKTQKTIVPLVAIIIVILSGATYTRNSVWQNWISIWSDAVSKSPAKPRVHNVLGIGYFYSLMFDEAMREYQTAVRLKPDFIEAYYNMGLIHGARKEHAEAITMLLKVLSISAFNAEQFAKAYSEIGIHYGELGEANLATKAFSESVKYAPESVEYRNNYAYALWMSGKIDDALREFQAVLSIEPSNSYAVQAIDEIKMQKAGRVDKKNVAGPKRTSDKN